MRDHVRTLGVMLVALFAVGAVLASSASATLPEWGDCVPAENHEGKYADAGCTEHVTAYFGHYHGAYEWYPERTERGAAVLEDRVEPTDQPVSQTTMKFASGTAITCGSLDMESVINISGPHTLQTPQLSFENCQPPEGEVELCQTTDGSGGTEITTASEVESEGASVEYGAPRGSYWTGALKFVEGKATAHPVVAAVFKTTPARERFLQQFTCDSPLIPAAIIGGHRLSEEVAMEITPVNEMSAAHTLTMSEVNGVGQPTAFEKTLAKPLEAIVGGKWEPVGFDATMLFPQSEGSSIGEPASDKHLAQTELELKATP